VANHNKSRINNVENSTPGRSRAISPNFFPRDNSHKANQNRSPTPTRQKMVRFVPTNTTNNAQNPPIICYACNKQGHIARECRTRNNFTPTTPNFNNRLFGRTNSNANGAGNYRNNPPRLPSYRNSYQQGYVCTNPTNPSQYTNPQTYINPSPNRQSNYRFPNPNMRQNMYQFNSRTVYPTRFNRNTTDNRGNFFPTGNERNFSSIQNEQMPRAVGTRNFNPRNNTWQTRQSNVNQLGTSIACEIPTEPQCQTPTYQISAQGNELGPQEN
jgi:hypothetical protein